MSVPHLVCPDIGRVARSGWTGDLANDLDHGAPSIVTKVVILLPSHWGAAKGGAELQAHLLADYLAKNTSFDVVYLARRVPDHQQGYGYPIEKIPAPFNVQFGLFFDALSLYRTLRRLAPNVIIQRNASAYTGIAAVYCERSGAKLVWYVSSDRDVEQNPVMATRHVQGAIDAQLFKYGVRHASRIIAQTSAQAEMLRHIYERPAVVIPNFHEVPEVLGKKSNVFTVLWISNLKPLKQPEIFDRLAKSFEGFDSIRFKLIGRPERSEWCDSILENLSTAPNLQYLGELGMDETNREISQAHVLVNTSLYEGFPNTFIQAWLRAVPTISLNVDPDGVIEGAGLGFRAGNFEELRAKVALMFERRDLTVEMGMRARNFATEHYSLRNAVKIVEVLRGLHPSRHGSAAGTEREVG